MDQVAVQPKVRAQGLGQGLVGAFAADPFLQPFAGVAGQGAHRLGITQGLVVDGAGDRGLQQGEGVVLGLTGLRMGELRGLRVRDLITVPYPALSVKRSVPQSARTGRAIERGTTKSGRVRTVPLNELVRPTVVRWAADKNPDDLLFPSPEGTFLRSGNWRRAVHWNETSLGRRPHDLRHTAASLWIAAGIDIKTVSAWLGHSTAKLTLDTYGHLMGTDADRAALERVNRLFGSPSGTRDPAAPGSEAPTRTLRSL
jgi:hypothetical protein